MILSKKTQIELTDRQNLIVSTLFGLNNESDEKEIKPSSQTQSVFKTKNIKKVGGNTLRLEFETPIKNKLREELSIYDNYLFLNNPVFEQIDNIQKVKLVPTGKNLIKVLLLYEVEEKRITKLKDRYLSIYLSEYEPVTAFDSGSGNCFIAGLDYLDNLFSYVNKIEKLKKIRRNQLQCDNPKPTKRMLKLVDKCKNVLYDVLHKLTRRIVDYCIKHEITTVVIGRAENIAVFPISRFVKQLKYKLKLEGIDLIEMGNHKEALNIERISVESKKLEQKIIKRNDWGVVSKENRLEAFNILIKHLDNCFVNY